MPAQPLSIFDDLEKATEKFIEDFQNKLPGANKQILAELNDFLAQLKRRANGDIVASVENLKVVDKYFATFNKILSNTDYGKGVNTFVKNYKESTGYMNSYFSNMVHTFKDNNAVYTAIIDSNINTTVDKLIGSGVDANFSYPLKTILKDNIKNGTNTINLRKALEAHILGDKDKDPALTRYSKQVASDSIHQFNRNYIQTVSNDLGLTYYYYRGTKIADSRPFCAAKAGKYFTEAQVLSWAHQKWNGMIAGTNEQNIKTNLGGWSCIHTLIPVSKELYDAGNNG